MRRPAPASLALAALALAIPAAALAHHGWGSYDAQNPVTLTGAVKTLEFANPHVHVDITAEGKDWELTFAPPSRMQSRGAVETLIKPGTTLTAYGYPSRVKPGEMRAEWIEVAGKRYELR
ncbi:hypothetical protein ASG72_09550 [Bosea sp. Leaf344]|jgi:hypothetical protein|uniref:DUF6152 family protein n=1 Tax=Bosea sp. Leaf344 TaxID=1736346 RepID=UPI0006FBB43F|nr:DUF6152 family protein [Bosea sp. Leaf344]KQU51749.1 hypothetical protein ASG72_09550 [Bosea sp. Leaf344]